MQYYDAAIVLGSGINEKGELSPRGKKRVEKGADLYCRQRTPTVILSGGRNLHRENLSLPTEAEAMKRYLLTLSVPDERILKEEYSRDTIGNLFFTKLLYLLPQEWRRLAIVTSDYHAERVEFLCEKILGERFVCDIIGVPSDLDADTLEEKEEQEQEKIEELAKRLGSISLEGGDRQIRDLILLEHPKYSSEPEIRKWLMQAF